MSLPFDRVRLVVNGRTITVTAAEFRAYPLPLRVRNILGGTIAFFRGAHEVDTQAALAALRAAVDQKVG